MNKLSSLPQNLAQKNWYASFGILCWFYVCGFFLAEHKPEKKSIDGMISAFEFLRITVVSDGLKSVQGFIEQDPWPVIMGIIAVIAVIYSACIFVLYFENPPGPKLRILPVGLFLMSIFLVFDYIPDNFWASLLPIAASICIFVCLLSKWNSSKQRVLGNLGRILGELVCFILLPLFLAVVLMVNLAYKISK